MSKKVQQEIEIPDEVYVVSVLVYFLHMCCVDVLFTYFRRSTSYHMSKHSHLVLVIYGRLMITSL